MFWILSILVAFALFFTFAKKPSNKNADVRFTIQRDRLNTLLPAEQRNFANECRNAALDGYRKGFDFAKSDGKSLDFCHEVGILEAARFVLDPNESRHIDKITKALQMETVPFNKIEPDLGKRAFIEYLVWKFFPDLANLEPVQEVMRQFVDNIYNICPDHKSENAFRYDAIYSKKYDWQHFALAAVNERTGAVK
jgi:hypothetical protein